MRKRSMGMESESLEDFGHATVLDIDDIFMNMVLDYCLEWPTHSLSLFMMRRFTCEACIVNTQQITI